MAENTGYVVMARKWRPSLFSDVVGQQHIVRALQNAITMNRIAGAYIFSGMRGVGKTSMARIFARSINCEKGPTVTPCGECKNCLEIANGSSMDVIEIDGASNNGVDEIRDIKDHVQYAPVKCRTKIYIIDEVHMLSPAAFNAFLKTLEEPPPHTLFIMATTEQSKIPETVLSRCQCFEFRAISDAQINQRLTEIAEKEKMDITPGAITMVARRAEGSMRDAQSMLDQAASYGGGTLDENTLGVVLGLVSREKVWAVMGAVMKKDTDLAIKQLHDLYYSGFDAGVIIRELCEASRTLAIAKVSARILERHGLGQNKISRKGKTPSARLQFGQGG
ncbi:MAG: DNA polymerase III subunit gamma/tau [Nitrospinae bacterium]|nr:DNA polymerase III subunit gamma/tau [Nitrospinota bacterium]